MMINGLRQARCCSNWFPIFRADIVVRSTVVYARVHWDFTIYRDNGKGVKVPLAERVCAPLKMKLDPWKYRNIELWTEAELERVVQMLEVRRALDKINEPSATVDALNISYEVWRFDLEYKET